jgi:hypothetical protein
MTQVAAADAPGIQDRISSPSKEGNGWTRNRVRRTMIAVGVVQLALVGWIVQTSGFQQDDYLFFAFNRSHGFTVDSLTQSVFGSLIPGFNFVNAVLASSLPVGRLPVVVLTLAMYTALVFVFYRLLELLFGARPGIVLLTSVGTCSGLLGVSLVWWTPAINGLPAIIADIVALDGLIRHAVTGRPRYLVISVVSFAVGTLFYDPSMEVLVALVLVTLLYLCDIRDPTSIWNAFRSRGWLWVGYMLPIAASLGWRFMHPGKYTEPPVGSISQIIGFMVGGLVKGMTPSALGVNYLTLSPGWWPSGIIAIGQLVLVGIVAATLIRNRGVWRAWTLFFVSFLAADLVAAIGRASQAFYFQLNSLYWAYFLFLFIIAFGLSVFPSCLSDVPAHATDGATLRRFFGRRGRWVPSAAILATAVLCSLGIHYIWTTPDHALGAANRVFTEQLQSSWSKVARHHQKPFVWDTTVPDFVLTSHFSPFNTVSSTMGLVLGGIRVDEGTGQGYIVDPQGRLIPAQPHVLSTQVGSSIAPGLRADQLCFATLRQVTVVRLRMGKTVPAGHWFLRIRYSGSKDRLVTFNSVSHVHLHTSSGVELVRFPVHHASDIVRMAVPPGSGFCLATDVERPVANGS